MKKNDWKRKLGSRKLWCAFGAWMTSLLVALGVGELSIAQVAIVISGISALVVYVLAETCSDIVACKKEKADEDES